MTQDQYEIEEQESVTPLEPNTKIGSSRQAVFGKACSAAEKIFLERNAQYGDAIVSTGVLGAAVELIGNTARLRQMVLKAKDHGRADKKALLELLKDIHNYANIAMMMAAEDNWEGD